MNTATHSTTATTNNSFNFCLIIANINILASPLIKYLSHIYRCNKPLCQKCLYKIIGSVFPYAEQLFSETW